MGRRTDQAPPDDVLPAQPPRRPARRPRRRLDHHQGEAEKRDAAHAADRLKETAQADVDLAGQRHGDDARAIAVVQDDFHAGTVRCVIADDRRQQLARDERRRAYCDAAVRDGCGATDHRRRRLQLEQAAVRDRQELGSELGERDLAGRAVEQAESELPLELAHQHAHSRLRDEQLLRGAGKTLMARSQHERLQLPRADIHGDE